MGYRVESLFLSPTVEVPSKTYYDTCARYRSGYLVCCQDLVGPREPQWPGCVKPNSQPRAPSNLACMPRLSSLICCSATGPETTKDVRSMERQTSGTMGQISTLGAVLPCHQRFSPTHEFIWEFMRENTVQLSIDRKQTRAVLCIARKPSKDEVTIERTSRLVMTAWFVFSRSKTSLTTFLVRRLMTGFPRRTAETARPRQYG
jgi:hypothetical protein